MMFIWVTLRYVRVRAALAQVCTLRVLIVHYIYIF